MWSSTKRFFKPTFGRGHVKTSASLREAFSRSSHEILGSVPLADLFLHTLGRKLSCLTAGFRPVANNTATAALKITLVQVRPQKEGFKVSLDLYLEADKELTVPTLGLALENAGALEVHRLDGALEAAFISGLTLTAEVGTTDSTIYAEDRKGMDFRVAMRCSIRIKGPEPEGQSSMEDLNKIAKSIAQACSSFFLITFQFEETLYWRDATGLHRT